MLAAWDLLEMLTVGIMKQGGPSWNYHHLDIIRIQSPLAV